MKAPYLQIALDNESLEDAFHTLRGGLGNEVDIIEVGTKYGVTALNTAMTMIIGKNVALMISPLVPATFLAIGLVDVELKDHIRFSFKWLFGISLVMLLAGFLLGVIQL